MIQKVRLLITLKGKVLQTPHNFAALMHTATSFPCAHYALKTHSKCIFNEMFGAECLFLSLGFHSDLLVEHITYQTAIF